jgi:hypothetical protein
MVGPAAVDKNTILVDFEDNICLFTIERSDLNDLIVVLSISQF